MNRKWHPFPDTNATTFVQFKRVNFFFDFFDEYRGKILENTFE